LDTRAKRATGKRRSLLVVQNSLLAPKKFPAPDKKFPARFPALFSAQAASRGGALATSKARRGVGRSLKSPSFQRLIRFVFSRKQIPVSVAAPRLWRRSIAMKKMSPLKNTIIMIL
jgi:hypothetical protein